MPSSSSRSINISSRRRRKHHRMASSNGANQLLLSWQAMLSLLLLLATVIPVAMSSSSSSSSSSYSEYMKLSLVSKSTPFCNGALTLESVNVECQGSSGECYFGTAIQVYGSILANKKLTTSATLGVSAYIDGLVSRDLGYTDDVNLCNYLTPTYDDETCPSAGLYDFSFSYTIPTIDDSSGWWFGYNNKIGINVDITDSYTDGTQFAASCHMMLLVTNLYDETTSSGYSLSPQTQRILYWSLLGIGLMTGGFWIGYSVRRRCRVVCLDDLNRMVVGGGDSDDSDDVLVIQEPPEIKMRTDEIIVHSAKFEIMKNRPPDVAIPTTQCNYLQPPPTPTRRQPQPLSSPFYRLEERGPAGVSV